MFTYLSVVVSLRAALVRHQWSLLPQAEPRPVSDHLSGVFCLWPAYAVQQAVHGESRNPFPHIRHFSFTFSKLYHEHNNSAFHFLYCSMTGIQRRPHWCWMSWIDLQKVRSTRCSHHKGTILFMEYSICLFLWFGRWLYWDLQLSVVSPVLVSRQSAYHNCFSSEEPQSTAYALPSHILVYPQRTEVTLYDLVAFCRIC